MQLNEFLKLAAAGAIIATGGSLLALFIKDLFLVRYFEDRRERKSLDSIFKKYKNPVSLSANELSSRLVEIHKQYPTVYLTSIVMKLKPSSLVENTIKNPHYRKYKLLSTVYRLCAFFGWLELYRLEITFLAGSNNRTNKKLNDCLTNIRDVFKNGWLNTNKGWKDYLIFKEEQRAIGESMIIFEGNSRAIIGFARFSILFEEHVNSEKNEWLTPAVNFFLDLNPENDFRKNRYLMLIGYFKELLEIFDSKESAKTLEKINERLDKLKQ